MGRRYNLLQKFYNAAKNKGKKEKMLNAVAFLILVVLRAMCFYARFSIATTSDIPNTSDRSIEKGA